MLKIHWRKKQQLSFPKVESLISFDLSRVTIDNKKIIMLEQFLSILCKLLRMIENS